MSGKLNYKINNQITAQTVRLVREGESDVTVSLKEAKEIAEEQELDLVLVSPNPPICKIFDYSKFLYNQKKKEKQSKPVQTKEIRFSSTTGENDFQVKVKKAIEFLKAKHKVKAYVHFKGRQITHKDLGEELLLRFAVALEEVGKVESLPNLMGKRMFITLAPK